MTRRRKLLLAGATLLVLGLGVGAWLTRDVSRLRLAKRARPLVEKRDLVYRPGSRNPKHRLDVYAPADAHGAPIVHFVHGGYWVGGDKDYQNAITGLYGSVGQALAARGIVTVVQSYRLVPEGTIEDLLDDVLAGVRFTEEHAAEWGGDPARLYLMGHSAGGHVVALLGADDAAYRKRNMNADAVAGYIPLSAVWDIAEMSASQDGKFQERVTYPVFGRDPARWSEYSPLAHLGASSRPFLIMIGDHDYPYLVPQASRARDRLVALGKAPVFVVAEGNDHDAMVLRFGARNDNLTPAIARFVGL